MTWSPLQQEYRTTVAADELYLAELAFQLERASERRARGGTEADETALYARIDAVRVRLSEKRSIEAVCSALWSASCSAREGGKKRARRKAAGPRRRASDATTSL